MKLEIVEARCTTVEVDDKYASLSTNHPDYTGDNNTLLNDLINELKKKGYKFHNDYEIKNKEIAITEIYSAIDNGAIMEW